MGELGLERAQSQHKVKRPRLNPLLAADEVGVVTLSVGGMHTAALTCYNKILTSGVNDEGALRRNIDEDEDDFDSNTGLNFKESTPGPVDTLDLSADVVWTRLACTDSATFALTDKGSVYGWGTFRGNEGAMGFDPSKKIQRRPIQVLGLRNIVQLAVGANHVLALSNEGQVYAWGAGQQNQLGRRIIVRRKFNGLIPTRVGLPKKIALVGAGSYHSFAVHESGEVHSWGLNSFGETGIATQIGGGGKLDVHQATVVESLRKFGRIICIDGGSHHTVALGLELSSLSERDAIRDSARHLGILKIPVVIPKIDAVYASAGSDYFIAVARHGRAYAWGFNENYQTGLGTNKDVQLATQIDGVDVSGTASNGSDESDLSDDKDSMRTAKAETGGDGIRGKKMVWAGCAGQFSILAGLVAAKTTDLNGVIDHA